MYFPGSLSKSNDKNIVCRRKLYLKTRSRFSGRIGDGCHEGSEPAIDFSALGNGTFFSDLGIIINRPSSVIRIAPIPSGNDKNFPALGSSTVFSALGSSTVFSALGSSTVFSALGSSTVFSALGSSTVFSALGSSTVFLCLG